MMARYTSLGQHAWELGVATVVLNILALALPLALLQVYDRIVPNQALGSLTLLMGLVMAAAILELILRISRSYLSGWIGTRFEHRAGCAAMGHMLGTRVTDFSSVGPGEHLERMSGLKTVEDFYAGEALITLLDLPFSLLFLIIIGLIGGWLAVVPAVLVLAFLVITLVRAKRLRDIVAEHVNSHTRRQAFTLEALSSIHSVKGLATEGLMLRRYERLQETCATGDMMTARHTNESMAIGGMFTQLIMGSVAAYGSLFVINQQMSMGALAACTLLAGRTLQPVQRVAGLWNRFQSVGLATERLERVFNMPLEQAGGKRPMERGDGALALEGVGFRYSETSPRILEDVSLTVAPGQCVGIRGGNGSGKSTLLSLVMGTLQPTEGRVLIDGQPLEELDLLDVRKHVAYLPQDGALFRGSILENITMFREDLEDEAKEVAQLLGLDEVVSRMPRGWMTNVGDTAVDSVPRGVKQRIAVARALIPTPSIILFDEANSAVDGTGDLYIRRALDHYKRRCTILLVTPRPSLLQLADSVYDLRDGCLVKPAKRPAPSASAAPVRAVADGGGVA